MIISPYSGYTNRMLTVNSQLQIYFFGFVEELFESMYSEICLHQICLEATLYVRIIQL